MEYNKEKRKESYQKNKDKAKQYYLNNREKFKKARLNYYYENKDKIKAERKYSRRILTPEQKQSRAIKDRERQKKAKDKIILHYGGFCNCCGEKESRFLTIDHIDNDGYKYKQGKTRLKGYPLYLFLIRNNYPKNVQLLCFNCNIGKRNNGGTCPHKN